MPDVHEGRTVPNGVVVATMNLVYPDLVGADIGCGASALRFAGAAEDLSTAELEAILAAVHAAVPTLKHSAARAEENASEVDALGELSCASLANEARREGRYQLGTIGRGNHFLELARDEEGGVWGVVHTGSRAMGHAVIGHHLRAARAGAQGELPSLDLREQAGKDYFADMQWACRYATANRLAILNALADALEQHGGMAAEEASYLDCLHNFARMEQHGGRMLLVHRKSANAADVGQRGIVAGSMKSGSRIVVGLGHAGSLRSSSHGAGRLMSRTEASEKVSTAQLKGMMRGIVYHEQQVARFRDEAPQAYRDLRNVMRAQSELVRGERALVPLLNDKRW